MTVYEELLEEVDDNGLIVREKPLSSSNGRIYKNRIAISNKLRTTTEKACVLSEELGHHYTSVGCILDQADSQNRKQERQARLWAYNKQIGLRGLIRAYEHGCRSRHEIAEFLEVTEEFLQNAIDCYRDKYGICASVDDYYIMFIPNLAVGKVDFSM
ncbi:MAG: ImmA/IrrE family metallo-endopeptidase [[Clostridium] scindens]|uniref:ImmA/IrrE family metallo-endopeptidase n=1 Tax=Clostridium scindens (strain JCM 10418 / VPI 12708) TaxID=29347 RepID=UPI0024312CB7|nr:ImmA/IrrE family metallo-endopeptidase [[Clostridium] scindens]MCI6395914.1 ImmA/IrrE family metallo-endopeptidase [[Clostridium] scindens]MDY4866546.1 ImmA/IrrE family metallo-endopeptidase [[Clostridium] scindens]